MKQHIGACFHCMISKTQTGKPAGELHPIPPDSRPFAVLHLDHLGPFITSLKGENYIGVIICNLTKYHMYKIIQMQKLSFERWKILLSNLLQRIITDRGTCFTSMKFDQFCQMHGIQHAQDSPSYAQANGQVERVNRSVIPTLAAKLDTERKEKVGIRS